MANEQPIIGPTGTAISVDGYYLIVRYLNTDIVRVAYLEIILDSGGSRSSVVQSRLNQTARQFNLGYHVLAPRGREWIVQTALGTYPFRDGMRIYRSPGGQHEYVTEGREG